MKAKSDRAGALLTLTPNMNFTLEKDGFVGSLYKPSMDEYPGKAVVMLGGSDGNFSLTKLVAEQYVKRGMTVLALAYWNYPGLPDHFENIPVETAEKSILWLRDHGYAKVGLWGVSKGAEMALAAGSLMPDMISCVVAVCPISIVCQGFIKKKGVQSLNCSSWSWREKELPWAGLRFNKANVLRDCIRERGICLRSCYKDAVLNASEEARIKVENIGGPVLLLSPEYDAMWPSEISAEQIVERLRSKEFSHPYHWQKYEYASHLLVPYKLSSAKIFSVERKHPDECMASNLDSMEKTLAFWKENW